MKFQILPIFIFLSFNSISQNANLNYGGTFIFSGIYKDGIIVASDSRSCYFDTSGAILAYCDSSKKIYEYKRIVFAISGVFAFEESDLTFSGLFNKFTHFNNKPITANTAYDIFIDYAKTILTDSELKSLKSNKIIVSGYVGNKRHIALYYNNIKDSIVDYGYRTNNINNNSTAGFYKQAADDLFKRTGANAILFANTLVQSEIRLKNIDNRVSIYGGETSILIIKKGAITWIKNNCNSEDLTLKDHLKTVVSHKLKMWYRSPSDSIVLEKSMKQYINQH